MFYLHGGIKMKNNTKNAKISLIISILSVIISAINLIYIIDNGKAIGSAVTLFCCMITILCANVTRFISNNNKYKNSSK